MEKILNRFGEVGYKNQHINRFTVPSVKKFMNDSNFQNVKVSKFLNFGIVFSILSISFGQYIEEMIERIFNGFFGYLLLIKIINNQKHINLITFKMLSSINVSSNISSLSIVLPTINESRI